MPSAGPKYQRNCAPLAGPAPSPATQTTSRDSLLAFVRAFGNSSSVQAAWQAQGPEPCASRWTGVTCSATGAISGLELPARGLQGAVSSRVCRKAKHLVRELSCCRRSCKLARASRP